MHMFLKSAFLAQFCIHLNMFGCDECSEIDGKGREGF